MCSIILMILMLLAASNAAHGFIIDPIDSSILSLYSTKYQSRVKLTDSDGVDFYSIEIDSFFEEQCILECMRNLNCARYEFSHGELKCRILIKKKNTVLDSSKPSASSLGFLHCKCNSDEHFYCAPTVNSGSSSLCFCSGFSSSSCSFQKEYQLSSWTGWSTCSAACNSGFQSRHRSCHSGDESDPVNLSLNDWLCHNDDNDDDSAKNSLEIKSCQVRSCDIYSPWSEWSECSRVCDGVRSRSRACSSSSPSLCQFLTEKEPCSLLSDCRDINPMLHDSTTSKDIIKSGELIMFNSLTNQSVEITTSQQDPAVISKLGSMTCAQLGLNELADASAIQSTSSSSMSIKCFGNETSIKQCHSDLIALTDYKVKVECTVNGYWSSWQEWSACSVTCGAGARTRTRVCNDPAPSQSAIKNGAKCPGKDLDFVNCIMPRCRP